MGRTRKKDEALWISRYWRDFWQDLWRDLRYAIRNLKRQPGFAAVAIFSAALGIGACATVFGIVNFALLRPLPVKEPDRLLALSSIHLQDGKAGGSLSYPEIADIRASTKSLAGVSPVAPFLAVGISSGGDPKRYWGFLVGANYFDVVEPGFAAGRGFRDREDDVPGAPAKIVLGHALWQSRFGGDPAIIGRTIQVNKRPMTVVGVTKRGFHGTIVGLSPDFYLPMSQIAELDRVGSERRRTSYNTQWLFAVARLKAGVDMAAAQAELHVLARAIRERVPDLAKDRSIHAQNAGKLMAGMTSTVTPVFFLLMGITFLVLLAACANVANLMLARASARAREIATRLAVGASRSRLIRQLITEGIFLGVAGGALGVALSELTGSSLSHFRLPIPIPIDINVSADGRVLGFAVTLSIITGVIFSLVPAWRATKPDLIGSIKNDARSIASLRRFGLRNVLVVVQIAISTVLLICSGLFLRSLDAARNVDSGMDTRNLLLVRFDPALSRYNEQQARQLISGVIHDAEQLPGTHSATVLNLMPLSLGGSFTRARAEGPVDRAPGTRSAIMIVGPRYFETIGIRMLEGREFPPHPSQEPVAIINQELARRLFPGQNVVGRTFFHGDQPLRIIGVVANSKYQTLFEPETTPIFYRPLLDVYKGGNQEAGLTLLIKSERASASLGEIVRKKMLARDPELVVGDIATIETHIRESMILPRLAAILFGLCGGIGLLIASIGVYGVISFAVARRTKEIGIRMALGAHASQVLRMVLKHGVAVSLIGIGFGITAGMAISRVTRSLLFGVSAIDPLTFSCVAVLLFSVALLATVIPARRAVAIDPNQTLRAE